MKHVPIVLAVLVAAGFAVFTPAARAGVAFYETYYHLQFDEIPDGPLPEHDSIFTDTSSSDLLVSGPVQHLSQTALTGGQQVLGSGQAVASYTSLKAVVTAFPGGDASVTLHSEALFEVRTIDQITVNAPGLAGQLGTTRISYQFDGSISGGDETAAASLLLWDLGQGLLETSIMSGVGPFSETVSIDIPFVFGVPIFFQSQLIGAVKDGGEILGSSIDVFNTAAMSEITVFDSLGQSVAAADIFGASGTSYNPFLLGSPVPEPSRALLQMFCAGMVVLVLGRRRRGWVSVC